MILRVARFLKHDLS